METHAVSVTQLAEIAMRLALLIVLHVLQGVIDNLHQVFYAKQHVQLDMLLMLPLALVSVKIITITFYHSYSLTSPCSLCDTTSTNCTACITHYILSGNTCNICDI